MTIQRKTDILLGVFICALVAANLLGGKITTMFGVSVSVGIFAYPLTFLTTDIVAEVHGKSRAKSFVLAGFIATAILFALTVLSVALPAAGRYAYNSEYVLIFKSSLRIIIASLVAFALSQTHDVWAFHFWKEKTKGKFLWLRNNLSTIISQFIDTTVFMFIAFYQLTPKFDFAFIWALILPYYLFKVLFAILDTPLVYLGVKWLKGKEKVGKEVEEKV